MIFRLNLDEMTARWKHVGLLEGIDDASDQIVLSIFFETMLRYLTTLTDEQKKLSPFNSETVFFPMLRRLFTKGKLPPKHFLSEYEVRDFETYSFFLTLARNIDERNLYEKEIDDYTNKRLSLNHRTSVQDDLAFAIKTFMPVLVQNFHQYVNYMKDDVDYMFMVSNLPDPEAEFLCTYCDNFNIENLLKNWEKRKEMESISMEAFNSAMAASLAKHKLPGSDPIVSTTST